MSFDPANIMNKKIADGSTIADLLEKNIVLAQDFPHIKKANAALFYVNPDNKSDVKVLLYKPGKPSSSYGLPGGHRDALNCDPAEIKDMPVTEFTGINADKKELPIIAVLRELQEEIVPKNEGKGFDIAAIKSIPAIFDTPYTRVSSRENSNLVVFGIQYDNSALFPDLVSGKCRWFDAHKLLAALSDKQNEEFITVEGEQVRVQYAGFAIKALHESGICLNTPPATAIRCETASERRPLIDR